MYLISNNNSWFDSDNSVSHVSALAPRNVFSSPSFVWGTPCDHANDQVNLENDDILGIMKRAGEVDLGAVHVRHQVVTPRNAKS